MADILRNTGEGIQRLMHAMFDIGAYDGWAAPDRTLSEAAQDYQTLYEGYVALLRVAHTEAHRRWDGTVNALAKAEGLPLEVALEVAHDRQWAGPGGDPNVVWVVRLIWLECHRSNTEMPPEQRVRPETLLLQWLIDDNEEKLVELIGCMPYWPIGLGADGQWC